MSSLRKSFVVYTFSNLFSTALPFLLLPILTYKLDQQDYGILSNFTGLIAFFIPVITINFVSAYSRQYYKEDVDIKSYVGTGISLQFLLTLGFAIILFFLESFIQDKTGIDPVLTRFIAIYCFVFGISELVLTTWRLEEKVWHFGIFRIGRSLVEVALTFYFVMAMEMDYWGRVWAILGAVFLGLIPVVMILIKKGYLQLKLEKQHLRHMLRYGLPLIPHALAGTILVYSDKMIITNEISLDANGLYSVAFQVALIIGLIQNSFNQAWVPWFYKTATTMNAESSKKIVRITYLYYVGLAVLTVCLIFGTPLIFMILGKEFKAGSDLVAWIAVGFLFNGMYKMKVNYLFYKERTITIGMITVLAAILNIVLNLILIRKWGLTGAAIATSITFVFQFIAAWIMAQIVFPMPWFGGEYKEK